MRTAAAPMTAVAIQPRIMRGRLAVKAPITDFLETSRMIGSRAAGGPLWVLTGKSHPEHKWSALDGKQNKELETSKTGCDPNRKWRVHLNKAFRDRSPITCDFARAIRSLDEPTISPAAESATSSASTAYDGCDAAVRRICLVTAIRRFNPDSWDSRRKDRSDKAYSKDPAISGSEDPVAVQDDSEHPKK